MTPFDFVGVFLCALAAIQCFIWIDNLASWAKRDKKMTGQDIINRAEELKAAIASLHDLRKMAGKLRQFDKVLSGQTYDEKQVRLTSEEAAIFAALQLEFSDLNHEIQDVGYKLGRVGDELSKIRRTGYLGSDQ